MPWNDSGIMTFKAAGTITAYTRVKFSGTAADPKVATSGATSADCGIALYDGATNDDVGVALLNKPGTFDVKLGAATAPGYGVALYRAASGKLTNHQATGATAVFTAVRKAAATNEVLEVAVKPNVIQAV
jgi:hypothetical protein